MPLPPTWRAPPRPRDRRSVTRWVARGGGGATPSGGGGGDDDATATFAALAAAVVAAVEQATGIVAGGSAEEVAAIVANADATAEWPVNIKKLMLQPAATRFNSPSRRNSVLGTLECAFGSHC
jgi:hypothetical protein